MGFLNFDLRFLIREKIRASCLTDIRYTVGFSSVLAYERFIRRAGRTGSTAGGTPAATS